MRTSFACVFFVAALCCAPVASFAAGTVPAGPSRRPCNRTTGKCVDLYVVAHPDDDLLFMNPDIQTSIQQGNRVIVVVQDGSVWDPTRPDRNEASQYWIDRERGNLNAYAFMARGPAGAFDHYRGTVTGESRGLIPAGFKRKNYHGGGLTVPRFDITANAGNVVSVIYVHLTDEYVIDLCPDPNYVAYTLACPYAGDPTSVCMGGSHYPGFPVRRANLLNFYVSVIKGFGVTSVSTLDSSNIYIDGWGTQGDRSGYAENENHIYSAMFALSAATQVQAKTSRTISIRIYRGYSILTEPQNLQLHGSEQWDKEDAFAYYALYDSAALRPEISGEPVNPTVDDPLDAVKRATPSDYFVNHRYDNGQGPNDPNPSYIQIIFYGDQVYESRKYVTRTVLGSGQLTGRLRSGNGGCLYASAGSSAVSLQDCASSPEWTITNRNQIQLSGTSKCLKVNLQGYYATSPKQPAEEVTLGPCSGNRLPSTMFLFGNGQIRTPNSRCLSYSASAQSDDCVPVGGGPAAASSAVASSARTGHPATDAIDGSDASSWQSNSNQSEWLTVDLGSVHVNLAAADIAWFSWPDQFRIDTSDDGGTWRKAVEYTPINPFSPDPNNPDGTRFDFPSATHGRYVRVSFVHQVSSAPTNYYIVQNVTVSDHVKQVPSPTQDWTLMFSPLQFVSTQFSDDTEVDDASTYYKTLGIVNHDVCVRRSDGVECSEWANGALQPPYLVDDGYSNALGWDGTQYGDTVRGVWFGIGGGPPVACGRGIAGPTCTNGLGSSDFADSSGWTSPEFYESLRFVDLYQVGSINVCGRGYYGISCANNPTGYAWSPASLWTTEFSDPNNWGDLSNAATIQFGDVNGDGTLDVCGRGEFGMFCAVNHGLSPSFFNEHFWSYNADRTTTNPEVTHNDFSDADSDFGNWTQVPYYDSIKLIDINRDGFADVCGRGPSGIYCALSTGTAFETKRLVDLDLADGFGWGYPNTGATISFGDLNGDSRVDVCARGFAGLYCESAY